MRWPCLWDGELEGSVWLLQGGDSPRGAAGKALSNRPLALGSRSSTLAKALARA